MAIASAPSASSLLQVEYIAMVGSGKPLVLALELIPRHFAKCEGAVCDESEIRYFPVRTIFPGTMYKKHLLEELRVEMKEWENAIRQLQEIQGE